MAEKTGTFSRLADRLAVESEPGLSTAQLMVRHHAASPHLPFGR